MAYDNDPKRAEWEAYREWFRSKWKANFGDINGLEDDVWVKLQSESAHNAEKVKGLVEALEHIAEPNVFDRPCCKQAWRDDELDNHDVEIADAALAAYRAGEGGSND